MSARTATTAATGEGEGEIQPDLSTDAGWYGSTDRPDLAATCFREMRDDPAHCFLDLLSTGLRWFPAVFWEQARGVESLRLAGNTLKVIPGELGSLGDSLQVIDLSDNDELMTLPGTAMARMKVMTTLILCDTGVVSLPDELFVMASLRRLRLSNCKALMKSGPADGLFPRIGRMTSLVELTLAGCDILGELDSAVGNLVTLELLDLSNNPEMTGIPEDALGQLERLVYLYIPGCKSFAALPASIGKLTCLTHLYCARSQLKSLPPQIGDCTALEALWLDECNSLTHLPPSLSRCTALETLSLKNMSALRTPPADIVFQNPTQNIISVLDYLRELDSGRLTKSANASASASAASQ